jgi:hypothetical protein
MYTSKEKNIIYNEILHPSHSEADLCLLLSVVPDHPKADRYRDNPCRHHEKILYELLDYKTREEIRANRRKLAEKTTTNKQEAGDVEATKTEPKAKVSPAKAVKAKAAKAAPAEDVVEKKSSKKKMNTP